MEYTKFMADRVKTMKGSAIREMFKRMADPEIISLAEETLRLNCSRVTNFQKLRVKFL